MLAEGAVKKSEPDHSEACVDIYEVLRQIRVDFAEATAVDSDEYDEPPEDLKDVALTPILKAAPSTQIRSRLKHILKSLRAGQCSALHARRGR